MASRFNKTRGQIALYNKQLNKINQNLSDMTEVTQPLTVSDMGELIPEYNGKNIHDKLKGIRDVTDDSFYWGEQAKQFPVHPEASPGSRQLSNIRRSNRLALPDLVNRSEMLNPLNDYEVQKKAMANDLINKRASTGKIYDFPEIGNPAVRHSENNFIDRVVRKEAAKKMEQEGISKVLSSYLNARKGVLGALKTAGKAGLKTLPFIGAAADIAMTPEAGEGKGSLVERSFQKPEGSQLTPEQLKKLLKSE